MKTLFYGFLFLVAAVLVAAIVVGVALKLVVFLVILAAVAGAAVYIVGRIYGPPSRLPGEGSEMDELKR